MSRNRNGGLSGKWHITHLHKRISFSRLFVFAITVFSLHFFVMEKQDDEMPVLSPKPTDSPSMEDTLKLRQLELEHEYKMKTLMLEENRLQLEREKLDFENRKLVKENQFNAAKNTSLVPKFNEKNVDKFFEQFEKIAMSLNWPVEYWAVLVQSVFKGKAAEAFAALTIKESKNYYLVKEYVLKAYELVPEAYRQNFRNFQKTDTQNYVEFAKEKQILFDRWLTSTKVGASFEKLKEVMLLEDFKNCIPSEIKIHINEQQLSNLQEAAVCADNYRLVHKTKFVGKSVVAQQGTKSDKTVTQQSGIKSSSNLKCAYCKRNGHIMSECWKLQKKQSVNQTETQSPNACNSITQNVLEQFKPFLSKGTVSIIGDNSHQPVTILRDTGGARSLILEGILPLNDHTKVSNTGSIKGMSMSEIPVPLHEIYLKSELLTGPVIVGVRPAFPLEGITFILGNDLVGKKVFPDEMKPILENENKSVNLDCNMDENQTSAKVPCDVDENQTSTEVPDPVMLNTPLITDNDEQFDDGIFPACVVTRSMAKKQDDNQQVQKKSVIFNDFDLSDTFLAHKVNHEPLDRNSLIKAQIDDIELVKLRERALPPEEVCKESECYYLNNDVLMRKWRPLDASPDDEWRLVNQIVVPKIYRTEILRIAHDTPLGGHLGVNKTYQKILNHFYWPGLKRDVSEYCKTCHECQLVGKPNQTIRVAPLQPIPAFDEPFSKVLIDCVGPLPKTKSGFSYLLTIMCTSTRFPEAIPLRNIKTKTIVKALTKFFTFVGLPKTIQSDQGTNFVSKIFQQVAYQLNINHVVSSAYHPESQGALERFHQTLKNMFRTYCLKNEKEWDEGVPFVLFAIRESVQESLGFSPFELIFGHTVRGPLRLLKEKWLTENTDINLLDYVDKFKRRLYSACKIAQDNLKSAQNKMKSWYDKNALIRNFQPGDQVLVLLPIPGNPLQARYSGPYLVKNRISDLNYLIETPDRRKIVRLCHVNMIKPYSVRQSSNEISDVNMIVSEPETSLDDEISCRGPSLGNSEILKRLDLKLDHLSEVKRNELIKLISEFTIIFPDVPNVTNVACHDVDVGDTPPIKQYPYRANPLKRKHFKDEIEYMLKNGIIEPTQSEWSSPCILVPKSDNTYRFVTDFRKVNSVTKTDSYPMPRIEDLIDNIGSAKWVTKFDLLKGYWQVPLTERAKVISAFVTPDSFFAYRVMPFGMKSASATFQRMINYVINDLDFCGAYIDDLIVCSDTWEDHVNHIRELFICLAKANLTVNLAKSQFCHATVHYLGYTVGQGQVKPIQAKVDCILNFPRPKNRKELMRYLGMIGFYRKFCANFATVVQPLTNLLRKDIPFVWNNQCQLSFDKSKSLLLVKPVLITPDFNKQFILHCDASDVGIGAVLLQKRNGLEQPIAYFSKKLNNYQVKYSTIEKECLALVMSLQHFDVYLKPTVYPVLIFTDHNPLVFLAKIKNNNQRLTRWFLMLQEYDIIVQHISGKENIIADGLSRIY